MLHRATKTLSQIKPTIASVKICLPGQVTWLEKDRNSKIKEALAFSGSSQLIGGLWVPTATVEVTAPTPSWHSWGNRLRDSGWRAWGRNAGLWQYLDKRHIFLFLLGVARLFSQILFVFRWLRFPFPSQARALDLSSLSIRTRQKPPQALLSLMFPEPGLLADS